MTHTTQYQKEIPSWPGRFLARCGLKVLAADIVGERPTCPTCAAGEAEDDATMQRLSATMHDPLERPVPADNFDIWAGYRPRKEPRR